MEAASLSRQRKPANTLRSYLGPEPEEARPRREFHHRLLPRALEAYRREEISRGKLRELGRLAQVPEAQMRELIAAVEVGGRPEEDRPDRRRGAPPTSRRAAR